VVREPRIGGGDDAAHLHLVDHLERITEPGAVFDFTSQNTIRRRA